MPNWTKEQELAINTEGSNIIVSAGAGSGKTAVLTERVITKLKKGVHINELLILTFTNNAAAEMKERIKKAISKLPELTEEMNLIETANITTFDAYVLSLVKKYHYYLGLDAGLSIIDASIIKLEKKKLIDKIFEDKYQENNKDFINFITKYCVKNDKLLRKKILAIDSSLDLLINKEDFLNNYIDNYHCEDLNVDISWLNIMDSCFVSNLCSTHHYIKYPTGKITWNVISESVKNLSNALILGNSSFVKR